MDFNSWEKLTLIAILMLQSLDTSLEEFQPLVLSFFIVMDGSSIRCAITGCATPPEPIFSLTLQQWCAINGTQCIANLIKPHDFLTVLFLAI